MDGSLELTERRDAILALAERHGVSHVRLFGSRVRGTFRPDSDLDVLVCLAEERSLLDHVAFQQDLEDLLSCRVDVVSERALHPAIRDRVLAEAVRL